jgi:hypothetical protein
MNSEVAFGSDSKYYAARQTTEKRDSRPHVKNLKAILDRYDPDLRLKDERAFSQWNNILRDYLRNETGLRLSVGDDKRALPVRIDDGLPLPFQSVLEDFPEPALWNLQLNSEAFAVGASGLEAIELNFEFIETSIEKLPASVEEIRHSRELLVLLNDWLKKLGLLKRIGAIHEDILGAYFFRVPEIRLYWMVIGLISRTLGVSAEALTIVVAAHELAHAYTHIGRDIDGIRWETEAFAATELKIAEGLAQFYTAAVCTSLSDRFPAAKIAYEALLPCNRGLIPCIPIGHCPNTRLAR